LDVEANPVSLKESVGSCQIVEKLIFASTENSSDSSEKQVNFITLPYPLGSDNTPE